jgi:hypothetical protein
MLKNFTQAKVSTHSLLVALGFIGWKPQIWKANTQPECISQT